MKKVYLVLAASVFSCVIQAAPQPIGGQVTLALCPLLAESVSLSLSNNVVGAYNCKEEPVAEKGIYVATCSTAGRTTPRSINAACNAPNLTQDDPAYNASLEECDANGKGPVLENFRGAFIYEGSTSGGQIVPSPEANQKCEQAAVNASVN